MFQLSRNAKQLLSIMAHLTALVIRPVFFPRPPSTESAHRSRSAHWFCRISDYEKACVKRTDVINYCLSGVLWRTKDTFMDFSLPLLGSPHMRTAKADCTAGILDPHFWSAHKRIRSDYYTRPIAPVFYGCVNRPSDQHVGFLPKETSSEASNMTSTLASSAGLAIFITLTVAFTLLLTCNLSWWVVAFVRQRLCSRDRLILLGKTRTHLYKSVFTSSPLKNTAGLRC